MEIAWIFSTRLLANDCRKEKKENNTESLARYYCCVCERRESLYYSISLLFSFLLYSWCCSRWDETLLGCVRCWELFRLTTYCCVSSLSHPCARVLVEARHMFLSPLLSVELLHFSHLYFPFFTCIHMYVGSILIRKVFVSPRCVSLRVCRCACEFVGKAFVGCGKCCKC